MQNLNATSFPPFNFVVFFSVLQNPSPRAALCRPTTTTTTMAAAASCLLLCRRLAYSRPARLSFPGSSGDGRHHLPAVSLCSGRFFLPAALGSLAPPLPAGLGAGGIIPLSGLGGLGGHRLPLLSGAFPLSGAFRPPAPLPLPVALGQQLCSMSDGGGGNFYFDTEVVGFKEITFKWALLLQIVPLFFQMVILFVAMASLYWQTSHRTVIPDILGKMDANVLMLDRHVMMFYEAFIAYCKNKRKRHMQMVMLFKGEGGDGDEDEDIYEGKVGRQPTPPPRREQEEDDGEDDEEDDSNVKVEHK